MRVLHQKIHQHLKLQQHEHTGKLLHHKHTSYRGLAVVFVLAGLAMVGVTIAGRVAADSLAVQGMVLAPVPSSAALIAQPADGAKLSDGSTLVAGSCPIISPQVIVQILVDGTVAGSATCDSDNDFSMPITLNSGAHALIAKTYTITNQSGPASAPVHITAPINTPAKTGVSSVNLSTDAPFSYLGSDNTASWSGIISGGAPPYHIHIDWNDGSQDNLVSGGGQQSFSHGYIRLASYNPLITVADSANHTTNQQFAVGTYTLAAAKISPSTYTSAVTPATLFGLYGILVTTVSISGIIWLEAKHAARHELAT
ncbi:MAG TPA: hypothetical protein VLG92_00480 [Candidatus Saccharimonadia bacterium]|nr:hypothetical protein [Candidatus Saccharimonadia bacterium]